MDTIVVNLFGEPSAGKSTCAMDITAQLKRHGINAEYVSEFAKDKVYENNGEVFKHQEYLFGKQSFKMGRVKNRFAKPAKKGNLVTPSANNWESISDDVRQAAIQLGYTKESWNSMTEDEKQHQKECLS